MKCRDCVSTDWLLARDGVSREVPCSALKGETVPDSLPATPRSPPFEVIDSSLDNLDSSLCFIQSSISHDVLCIEVK